MRVYTGTRFKSKFFVSRVDKLRSKFIMYMTDLARYQNDTTALYILADLYTGTAQKIDSMAVHYRNNKNQAGAKLIAEYIEVFMREN